jgi:hypothetical protein
LTATSPFYLGDYLDDYAVNPKLRNDFGLLFLIDLAGNRLEAIPLKLELVHMRLADGSDAAWVGRRFRKASAAFGSEVAEEEGRLVLAGVRPSAPSASRSSPTQRTE